MSAVYTVFVCVTGVVAAAKQKAVKSYISVVSPPVSVPPVIVVCFTCGPEVSAPLTGSPGMRAGGMDITRHTLN